MVFVLPVTDAVPASVLTKPGTQERDGVGVLDTAADAERESEAAIERDTVADGDTPLLVREGDVDGDARDSVRDRVAVTDAREALVVGDGVRDARERDGEREATVVLTDGETESDGDDEGTKHAVRITAPSSPTPSVVVPTTAKSSHETG